MILRKPLFPTENPPPGFLTHAGGPRWPRGADSEEYRTLLAWIKGAKHASVLERPEEARRLMRAFLQS